MVLVYSEPQILTTVVTDGSGSFSVEVTVPDGFTAGRHTLVASGVDALGNVRTMTLPVTVTQSVTVTRPVTVSRGATDQAELAHTGADIAVPVVGGLAAVAAGGVLLLMARRRTVA
jgi:hypothetical protein